MRLKDILNNTTIKRQEHQDSNPDLTPEPMHFPILPQEHPTFQQQPGSSEKIPCSLPIAETPVSVARKTQYMKQTVLFVLILILTCYELQTQDIQPKQKQASHSYVVSKYCSFPVLLRQVLATSSLRLCYTQIRRTCKLVIFTLVIKGEAGGEREVKS